MRIDNPSGVELPHKLHRLVAAALVLVVAPHCTSDLEEELARAKLPDAPATADGSEEESPEEEGSEEEGSEEEATHPPTEAGLLAALDASLPSQGDPEASTPDGGSSILDAGGDQFALVTDAAAQPLCDAGSSCLPNTDFEGDACPDDPDKEAPGECGCGTADVDSDLDEVPDCIDGCPDDPDKTEPGLCGCNMSDEDRDSDGAPDCMEQCPTDPEKVEPGLCGCGSADGDTDEDRVPDCTDACPTDPQKVDPGVCGCNQLETDTDADGAPDCVDECPQDATKTSAGTCGCGYSEATGSDSNPDCLDLSDSLIHRYRFNGSSTSTIASDSVGEANGTLIDSVMSGTGSVTLSAGSYVDLPNQLLSGLSNATLEVWLEPGNLDSAFQRIFDFGDSGTEGESVLGRSYIYLTPRTTPDKGNAVRLTFYGGSDGSEVALTGSSALPQDTASHVACVFDNDGDRMHLYVNGTAVADAAWVFALSDINDINNWLGKSQFVADPGLEAAINEFRLYDVALDAAQIQYSFGAGPDPLFLE